MRSRPLLVPALLFFLLSLICTQIPLLNYLGFEFSLIISIAISVAAAPVTIGTIRAEFPSEGFLDAAALLHAFRVSLLWSGLLLAIPLLVSIVNIFFVRNCSVLEGLAFYLLLPGVTSWFSVCLAFFCAVHYRHPHIMYFALFTISIFYAAALGYFTPAIFSYNFFYGYFPGFTYDEIIEMTWTIILWRLLTVLAGGVLLFAGVLMVRSSPVEADARVRGIRLAKELLSPRRRWGTALTVAACALLYVYRGPLGFESSSSFIEDQLGAKRETEHFTLYYSGDSCDEKEISWIASEHEFRLAQVCRTLGISIDRKIESYIYPSDEIKLRYIGAGGTNIAKPWSSEIHLSAGSVNNSLKHELVHVVAAPFGIPLLRTSLHPGLTEGLAMAVEWSWGNRTLHEYSAIIRRSGLEPDMGRLMSSPGFAASSSSVSYILAGSFCRFLIDSRGMNVMTDAYTTGAFESAFGDPLADLIDEWHALLDSLPTGPADSDIADVYFRTPSIFLKTCPRTIAKIMKQARREFSEQKYSSAGAKFLKAHQEGRGPDAVHGMVTSFVRGKHPDRAIAIHDTVILVSETPASFLSSFLFVGDAFWMEGRTAQARELYTRVTTSEFSDSYGEGAALRLLALDANPGFVQFFVSTAPDSVRERWIDSVLNIHPEDSLARFLKGRLLGRSGAFNEAFEELSTTNIARTDVFLEFVRLRTVGIALLRLGRVEEGREWFRKILDLPVSGWRIQEATDWLERCDWLQRSPGVQE
jgi:hypothetical protein